MVDLRSCMTRRSIYASILAALTLSIPHEASAAIINGESAYTFNQRVGMNIHPDQMVGQWPNYPFIQSALKALNIHWVRSSLTILPGPNNAYANFLQTLDANDTAGNIRSDLIVAQGTSFAQIKNLLTVWGVSFVEAPNEYDISGNADWANADLAETLQLSQVPSVWSGISVVAPSLVNADPKLIASPLNAFGNMHDYFGSRPPETPGWGGEVYGNGTIYGSEAYNIATAQRAAPGKPVISTESGYTTIAGQLSEYTQAAYLERLILQHAMSGVTKGFLYDLVDDSEQYGLFHTDGSPKLAANGLQGFLNFLGDTIPPISSTPCALNATLTSTATIDSFLVCKNNGEMDLVFWQPAQLQDPATYVSTPVSPATVSVVLGTAPVGATNYYAQSTTFNWLEKNNPTLTNLTATERPSILALNAQSIALPPLPMP